MSGNLLSVAGNAFDEHTVISVDHVMFAQIKRDESVLPFNWYVEFTMTNGMQLKTLPTNDREHAAQLLEAYKNAWLGKTA